MVILSLYYQKDIYATKAKYRHLPSKSNSPKISIPPNLDIPLNLSVMLNNSQYPHYQRACKPEPIRYQLTLINQTMSDYKINAST